MRLLVGKLYCGHEREENKRVVRESKHRTNKSQTLILTATGLLPKKLMSFSSPKRNASDSADSNFL